MFKVVVEQLELMEGLRKIKNTVGKGKDANNQTDKYVYMETYMDNIKKAPMLRLVTTNFTEISEALVEVVSADIGVSPLMEYDKIFNMVGTIDDAIEITLHAPDEDTKLFMNYVGRRQAISFNCMPSAQFLFQTSPVTTSEVTVPYANFKEGLDAAATIISDDDRYPVFNCVHVTIADGMGEFEAIDSNLKRMVVFSKPMTHTNEGTFFVECNKVRRMISGFDATKNMNVLMSDNNIVFEQDGLKVTTRLLQGTFPEIKKFMPSQYAVETVFNRDEMLTSLKRAKIMFDNLSGVKSCIFDIDQGFLTMNMNSQIGMLHECVINTLTGNPTQMAFMVDSISQALAAFSEPSIKMCFYSKSSCVLMPENPQGYSHKVLVPAVRIIAPTQ